MARGAADRRRLLGVLAIVFYATHGAYHVLQGHPENLLWTCHMGSLAVGVGLLARSAELNGIGVLWLSIGTPLWLAGLATGGLFLPTSMLTHLGGLAVGIVGIHLLGASRGAWWKALVGLVVMHALARPITPPGSNVNFARAVWPGWETTFPSHLGFLMTVLAGCGIVFLTLETALRRLLSAPGDPRREKPPPIGLW